MLKGLFSPDEGADKQVKQKKANISSRDIVTLSFKLWFQQIQFWIQPNLWMLLLSIPILTSPGANAAMYQTVATGLRDPALIRVKPRREMKAGSLKFVWRALFLSTIKWSILVIILVSLWFWINQETWLLRSISVISIYGLALWWLIVGYLYPILVEHPESRLPTVFRQAVVLVFRKPFDSLLFAIVSSLLSLLGIILLGPILVVIPSFRSILHIQGYWFLTGQIIPGFIDTVEYSEKYYD